MSNSSNQHSGVRRRESCITAFWIGGGLGGSHNHHRRRRYDLSEIQCNGVGYALHTLTHAPPLLTQHMRRLSFSLNWFSTQTLGGGKMHLCKFNAPRHHPFHPPTDSDSIAGLLCWIGWFRSGEMGS